MIHARKDYKRVQDLAAVAQELLAEAEAEASCGNPAAAANLKWFVSKLEAKYGPLVGVKPIPENELVFLLRSKDKATPCAVRMWADEAEFMGAAPNILESARKHALAMEVQQTERGSQVPDMPEGT